MNLSSHKQNKIRIYCNRKSIAIASLITTFITLLGLGFIYISLSHADPRFIDYVIGILLVLYFGFLTFDYWTYWLKNRNKPVLIIDEKGIWDNTLFSRIGSIAWREIEEIDIYDLSLKSGGRARSLGIIPKTGRQYLRQFPLSWQVRRIAIAAFFRFPLTQTPINILLRDLHLADPQAFESAVRAKIGK